LFIASVLAAALVAFGINASLPDHLAVSTDIIGYPIAANFDITRYRYTYLVVVAVFPALVLAIYAVGSRLLGLTARRPWRLPPPEIEPDVVATGRTTATSYSLVVGAGLAVEVAIAAYPHTKIFWPIVIGVVVLYALGVQAAAWLAHRAYGYSGDHAAFVIVAMTAPLALLGLYVLSRVTSVTVVSTQSGTHYPWLPPWLAVLATAVVVAVVVVSLRRAGSHGGARVARATILYLSAPLLLMVLIAQLPDALRGMDMFDDGERLAAATLTLHGALPWRDLLTIHGLLEDVFREMLGMVVFQDSRWGGQAGTLMLFVPVYWYLNYLLFVRLFRRNWFAVAAAMLMTAGGGDLWQGLFFQAHYRMLLLPLVLLLFARLLDRGTWPRAASVAGTAVIAFVLTPEMSYLAGALAVTLVAWEWLHRADSVRWWQAMQRVGRCAACSAVAFGIFVIYLLATHSLSQYVSYFRTFAPGHALTGGIPIQWTGPIFGFAEYSTVAIILIGIWYFVGQLRARRTMSANDWTMTGLLITVALYYPKFLDRADTGHLFEVWSIAIPLFYYEVYKLVEWMSERATAQRWRTANIRRAAVQLPFASLLVLVLVLTGSSVESQAAAGPDRFRAVVPEPALVAREGYVLPGQSSAPTVKELKSVLGVVMLPGDTLYDFSNEPAMFYYLLHYTPPTRFYHVSMAIPREAQRQLIDELKKSTPDIVIYDDNLYGLPSWDGVTNSVRHYDVSRYLLEHYEPFIAFDGYTLMAKDGRKIPQAKLAALKLTSPRFQNLYFPAHACAWGYTPNFFDITPGAQAGRSDQLVGTPVPRSPNQTRYALPADAQQYQWLELGSSHQFTDDTFVLSVDGDPSHVISFATLPRSGRRYRVMLSNCAQWYGFTGGSFVLSHTVNQPGLVVRLVK
jgi:hypothetical protein